MSCRFISAMLFGLIISGSASADDCGMQIAFHRPDGNQTIAVWRDSSASRQTSLLFRNALQVNTDGTRESYSIDDFWGADYALNNLCNAMSDNCSGLTSQQKYDRRVMTQQALAAAWPPAKLTATKIDPAVIAFENGHPCPELADHVGNKEEYFLVSETTLAKPVISNACDPNNYLDAATVPALVLPERTVKQSPTEFEVLNARVGDLVVAITPNSLTPVYAVVGDLGPPTKLGEGSIALNGELKGISRRPANYIDVKKNWVVADAIVLIFPGTRKVSPYLTTDRIDTDAAASFLRWGGGTLNSAMARLKACFLATAKN
jgi:hypothetical protein